MKRRRRNTRAYYHRKPEPNAFERLLDSLFGGVFEEAPPSRDPAGRAMQLLHQSSDIPIQLVVLLVVLGLGGLAFGLWKLVEAALMRGPMGRVYGASRAVRRQLLKSRKASTRLPPTPEALEAAWAKSRRSLEWKLRLGSMLEDLEPAVDQSYIRDDEGAIVGREAGIRGWLWDHCREVSDHYKTAMGYKALAHRFRLAIDLPEPFTMEDVLDVLSESIESIEEKEKAEQEARRIKVKNSDKCTAAEATATGRAGTPTGAPEALCGSATEGAAEGAAEGAHGGKGRVLPPPLRGTPLPEGGIMAEGAESSTNSNCPQVPTNPNCPQVPINPNCSPMTTNPNQNVVVVKATEEAGEILATLRKRNGKKGRVMGRSMGALDEILHGKLKLLHIPRSA